MRILQRIALAFTIIGAINWGLLNFNLVSAIFGVDTILSRIIYTLVGIAGLINIGLLVAPLDEVHD